VIVKCFTRSTVDDSTRRRVRKLRLAFRMCRRVPYTGDAAVHGVASRSPFNFCDCVGPFVLRNRARERMIGAENGMSIGWRGLLLERYATSIVRGPSDIGTGTI